MASMFSVAKFLTIARKQTGTWRANSADATLASGDKEVAKSPSPAPVASEVVPIKDKPEVQPTKESPSPQVSRTQSEAAAPKEDFKTPQEDAFNQSTWTGDESGAVVHEPDETQSIETKVESKTPSVRQRSSSSLSSGIDRRTSTQGTAVEPSNVEEQKTEKHPEIVDVLKTETPADTDILTTDYIPTHAEPQQTVLQDETALETPFSEKEVLADDSVQEEPRNEPDVIDQKLEEINHPSDEVDRLRQEMEDVRRAGRENEEAARKETQRVKTLIAVERHSHLERVKQLEQEKARLSATLEAAKRETQRVKGLIAVERHSHGERVKELEQEREEFIETLEATKKETQRVKGLIAVARHSHNERLKEVEQDKEELTAALEAAKKETQRVKGLIAVERHSHGERVREFEQEKDGLMAALEAARSDIMTAAAEIESQNERVRGLEGRLENSREEARELNDKCQEQASMVKRLEEDIVEERDKALMKSNQVQSQKAVNHSLSSSLVELQAKTNKTERHNRMLLEQLRQQSDQLQNRQYADSGLGGFMVANTLYAFSSLTRGIRRGAHTARADMGLKSIKQLNDEIFQLAASLTDQLEGFDKRFVSDDSLSFFSGSGRHEPIGVRRVKAEYLKSTLGLELIDRLEKDAPYPMKDVNPFHVQIALQGCLTACCMRIITSWYPSEWEYGKFLEALYDRIRGTGGLDTALSWRKTTQQNCVSSIPRDKNSKLVNYLMDDLRAVLSVSGWSRESDVDALTESLREKLFNLVSLSLRLNGMTATGVPGELEPILVERGSSYDWREMGDDCAPNLNRSRKTDLIPKEERVICAVTLGLRWSDGSDVDMPRLLLKPRVVLDSAIVV